MMNKFVPAILIALALAFGPQTAAVSGQDKKAEEQQVRRELEALFAQISEAISNGEHDKKKKLMTADFQVKLPNGKTLSRNEIEVLPQAEADSLRNVRETYVIEDLKAERNQAVVKIRIIITYQQKLQDGTYGEIESTLRQRETWVKTDNGWRWRLIDDISPRKSGTVFNGKKVNDLRKIPAAAPKPVEPNEEDKAILQNGKAVVFIYRLEAPGPPFFGLPVYCDAQELARIKKNTFIKVKLEPGKYQFRSDKEPAFELAVEGGKLYYLSLKPVAGFPKARGLLSLDEGIIGPQLYKLPKTLKMKPLDAEHIKDAARVISN